MSVLTAPAPAPVSRQSYTMYRISVDEYHKMIEHGIFGEDEPIELLEGYLVQKMPHNLAHDGTILRSSKRFSRMLPIGWDLRIQSAITLGDSEPEPDLALVRVDPNDYSLRHPGPADIGVLLEASESSLDHDRDEKSRIYARAGIVCYWIINLVDRQVEVFTNPSGPTAAPAYANLQVYRAPATIPLMLDGTAIGDIPVADLLP